MMDGDCTLLKGEGDFVSCTDSNLPNVTQEACREARN